MSRAVNGHAQMLANLWNEAARILRAHAGRLGGVLLDVLPANVGCIPASREFLDTVTATAREIGALTILVVLVHWH